MSMDPRRPSLARGRRLLGPAALTLVLAACTSAGVSPVPSASPAASAAVASPAAPASTRPTPTASTKPSPSPKITQTDTAWGRIWDEVPATFPVPAGGLRITADHPVSAAWSVANGDAASLKDELRTALQADGLTTANVDGPLEDGTYIIDSIGKPDACHVQTRVTPLGTMITVTVMFGAACPFR